MIFIGFNNETKGFKFLIGCICAICIFLLVKNTNYFTKYVEQCIVETAETKENFEIAKEKSRENPLKIFIVSSSYYGIEFNLKDADINYIKVGPYEVKSKKLYGNLMFMEDLD